MSRPITSIWLAKSIRLAARLSGNHGSALPGLVVERTTKSFLRKMLSDLPKGVVVITGTNGKTTTTRMLVHLLREQGLRVLSNPSGSNLTRGVISTVVEHSTAMGILPYDVAVFELDEAFSPIFTEMVHPKLFIALNVLRDQLDRYGEIDGTAQLIARAAKYADKVLVNAEDGLLAETIKSMRDPKTVYGYGMNDKLLPSLSTEATLYASPTSAKKKHQINTSIPIVLDLADVKVMDELGQTIKVGMADKTSTTFKLSLLGIHNAFNATAALAAYSLICPEKSLQNAKDVFKDFKPAFGRGETVELDGKELTVSLIKNPSGFLQNLNTFVSPNIDAILIVINDKYADGRDVSWLWDTPIDKLKSYNGLIFVSGTRRYDMALRLKYEGIGYEVIDVEAPEEAVAKVIERAKSNAHLLIMPTYTAMVAIRHWLGAKLGVKHVW
jgi:UDP-N-acetylmuramyl tripeptide synthase